MWDFFFGHRHDYSQKVLSELSVAAALGDKNKALTPEDFHHLGGREQLRHFAGEEF